jgi:hypothetical protein
MILTTKGPMLESELEKREQVLDNENEHTTSVEYCLIGCPGLAHKTGVPDASSHFCNFHVHRSAHVRLKKPLVAFGEAAQFE